MEPEKLYHRSQFAVITREINKLFNMPVMILFKTGAFLTFSIIHRRPHKRDHSRDVLEKVTLIKDISLRQPHRAQVEILYDLSLQQLKNEHPVTNFRDLHQAWQETLDISVLNDSFYKELEKWYFWAIKETTFPDDGKPNSQERHLIRLITRLIFVWFIKEKGWVPSVLFDKLKIDEMLNKIDSTGSTYYKAILQNLFFATLNTEIGSENRCFVTDLTLSPEMQLIPAYCYQRYFKNPVHFIDLLKDIPFLNGGLFENLDFLDKSQEKSGIKRIDCFSNHQQDEKLLKVPDKLFFCLGETVDLRKEYGLPGKNHESVRGIIEILNHFKFTIEENTPVEQEIALDPELLGEIFQRLLAAYNPETRLTARKKTGSYYTPREIVDYMVDETLIGYLENYINQRTDKTQNENSETFNNKLRHLLAYHDLGHQFSAHEVDTLIEAIDNIKILDPACGSGAFPMGMLQKLVHILGKLDLDNQKWLRLQIHKIKTKYSSLQAAPDEVQQKKLQQQVQYIKEAFDKNAFNYARKLFLLINSIYGVDIQPIAVQISKLRFFIALIIDQKDEPQAPNRNIIPLPNLELNFVSADSLYTLDKQYSLIPENANKLIEKLENLRFAYAWTHFKQDKEGVKYELIQVRQQIQQQLQRARFANSDLGKLFKWDLFNQNASAVVFNKFWMYGLTSGFDCVIGNPPYIRQEEIKEIKPTLERLGYVVYNSTSDIYTYFYEAGFNLLKSGGSLTFITSNKWLRAKYGTNLRRFLKKNTRIQEIVDFGGHQVFKSSTVDTCIVRFEKGEPAGASIPFVNIGKDFDNAVLSEYARQNRQYIAQPKLNDTGWTLADGQVLALKEKIEKMGTPLKDWDVKIYRGILTGLNEAFIIDTPTKERLCAEDPKSAEILKPILRGRDIGRYWYEWKGLWIIFTRHGINIEKYPAIKKWLEQFYEDLKPRNNGEKRGRKPGSYKWYEIQDNIAYYREFEREKIVWAETAQEIKMALVPQGYYLQKTCFMVTGKNLRYIEAISNSKLIDWYTRQTAHQLGEDGLYVSGYFMNELPIPKITLQTQNHVNLLESISQKVRDILKISKSKVNNRLDINEYERQINLLVYKLYAMTYEEVKIIDPGFELTETEYENWQIDFDGKQSLEVTEKRPPAKAAGVGEQKKVG
jgi:type II restriction/modification system DNA methylase subunit YeeA